MLRCVLARYGYHCNECHAGEVFAGSQKVHKVKCMSFHASRSGELVLRSVLVCYLDRHVLYTLLPAHVFILKQFYFSINVHYMYVVLIEKSMLFLVYVSDLILCSIIY
jgi:hypothetical protein